ncbi:hypothetical protein [Pseudoxanthomonas japonensis]|uniref:Uncharacterized protein n=1 Tax=Pseudoxanthomonas japonensis TaxID=69284 RepID=A0ABQ6ZHG0_9GAMM|nr:hypothetical protein [Pseudoxanthomonas japonensis]KAF1725239.1 hypothetical protein CSC78_09600 [Pseudoxanthomonas japonensis]
MGWGNKRRGLFVWVLAVASGLAAASGVAAPHAADDGNTKSSEAQGGVRFSIDREEYDAQARAAMQVDPVVAAHLGAIRTVALDDAASMDEPGPDVLVFDVEGSRGKGRVTARFITVSATQEALGPGMLVMADGTRHEIEGDADALAAEDGPPLHDHAHDEDVEAGANAFIRQAQEAAQRYPLIRQHIGQIASFEIDTDASGAAPGMNTFVFDVAGDKGRGRLEADFITVSADTERLGKGVLTLAGGRKLPFEGEPRGEDEPEDGVSAADLFGGDNIFTRQARVAVQRYPLVQQHIGTLASFELDLAATGEAEGAEEFVFALTGDKGRGRILAEFITVDADTERLGKGVLTLADGREIAFEGEAPMEGELAAPRIDSDRGEAPDTFARQDGIFVLQANAAMQAHPVVQRHIGDIREAAFDRDASWKADGERYIFDLKGSKGQGRLEAEFITVDADSERIGDGELVMADGKRYPLDGK